MASVPPPPLQINKGIRDYYTIALFHYYAQDTLKKIVYIQALPPFCHKKVYLAIITLLHQYDTYKLLNKGTSRLLHYCIISLLCSRHS